MFLFKLRTKVFGLVVLGLVLGLMLMACGDTASNTTSSSSAAPAAAAPNAAPAAAATPKNAEANTLYSALQKTYQSKSLKVSGKFIENTTKTDRTLEIVPGDRLKASESTDGKTSETLIVGNSRYSRNSTSANWNKDQAAAPAADLSKQQNTVGLFNPTQLLQVFDNNGATVNPVGDGSVNGESVKIYQLEFSSVKNLPNGVRDDMVFQYSIGQDGIIKRVEMSSIGSSANYVYSDFNAPVQIDQP
jgi:hypothetical protein